MTLVNPISKKPYTDAELVELALERTLADREAFPVSHSGRKALLKFRSALARLNIERRT